jgi:DNA polymerase-2
MAEYTGWLLDLFEDPEGGVALWLLEESGERLRLRQRFPVTFYASGPAPRLRALWQYLEAQPVETRLRRDERRDLFLPRPLPVLAVEVERPSQQPRLFQRAAAEFNDLTFYDADIPLALRHAAAFGTFPLARCRVEVDAHHQVQRLETLETRWTLDPVPVPLRILELEPDREPGHGTPTALLARYQDYTCRLPLQPARPLLVNLRALLQHYDPDLLLTAWGDTWLLPHLLDLSRQHNLPLPLSREPGRGVAIREPRSYFSYGQIIFRGQQITLFGRLHLDRHNATLWGDYGLDGTLEVARVTALPLQAAARLSPGSGISAMQVVCALHIGALVPWHKQQVERPKTALDLLHSDQGGLVYQPLIGLHRDVGAIDFISMYPSIMVRGNISPETRSHDPRQAGEDPPGLIPQTLGPLLEKRVALKQRLGQQPSWHPQHIADKARSSAHKWLLVTCFGYLGYKNARFGRIEAHEAVTAGGREALLRAKEAAEDRGFTILHLYVDALWVKKPGASRPEDFQALLEDVSDRTGLSISLDGVYRWVAFLPSRVDDRAPVANRYFGVFQDGSLKMRGIEARRRDTPTFIAEVQQELLEWLARAQDAGALPQYIPGALKLLRYRLAQLKAGQVPPEKLLMGLKLSRKLEEYTTPSPAARAAAQLQAAGKTCAAGQRIRFLWLRGQPDVHAWDLPTPLDPRRLDLARYRELTLRAAETVFLPMGLEPAVLRQLVDSGSVALPLAGTPAAGRLPEAIPAMLSLPDVRADEENLGYLVPKNSVYAKSVRYVSVGE